MTLPNLASKTPHFGKSVCVKMTDKTANIHTNKTAQLGGFVVLWQSYRLSLNYDKIWTAFYLIDKYV
ncbi:hypothetical protein [Moraxella lacunata]|uniref:hypothetical protein n=1 Tax=Moraxella lacunata TaxID=477 RepID=UPI003EE1C641